MSGPFSGFGIHSDLQVESFSTAKDPYYKQIKEILSSNNIMETLSIEKTKLLQKELLYPYLEFFIRNDNNDYYKNLFFNRGIAKDNKGNLKNNLDLHDLIKLRIHSDDLRGDGQKSRLIYHSKNKNEGYQFFFNKRTIAKKNEIITYIINLIFLRIVKRGKRLFTNINSFESLSL